MSSTSQSGRAGGDPAWWWGLLGAVLSVLALGPLTTDASAHAAFLESTPGAGARVERSPGRIVLDFTEPLNRGLSRAALVPAGRGEPLAARLEPGGRGRLTLRPLAALATGAYRLEWHTVSTEDGHALEGSLSFGVRAPALAGGQQIEQSPLARRGWIRIALRGLFYAALVFFGGGVIVATLLGSAREPAGWLVPRSLEGSLGRNMGSRAERAERAWRRTVDCGWLAAGLAVAVAVAEATDAGGLSLGAISDFLLSNVAGLARTAAVLALAGSALLASRRLVPAAGLVVLAFLAVALGGHANSADPRFAAVATDAVHLLAAAVWLGGLAQIALAWLPLERTVDRQLRRAVMAGVLKRFGRLALPAFLIVASTGLANAWIQLGEPSALWQTSYGRLLGLKIALVAATALVSYWHAIRLRPRLLRANPRAPERLERRHWRLLGSEPLLTVAVVGVAAALVAFPLPPRQLADADEAQALAGEACDPCPQPKPRANELAVAEQAGSSIAAVWVRRDGTGLAGRLRVLDRDAKPVASARARIRAAEQTSCGPGCLDFRLRSLAPVLDVRVRERDLTSVARVPVRWRPDDNARARRLLRRSQSAMGELRSVRQHERVTSGPGSLAETWYRLRAPDRLAYRTNGRAESVTIGADQWSRVAGLPWRKDRFGGGGPAFRTRSWFRWTSYSRAVRLLGVRREGDRRVAEVALMDQATPVWFRLTIDLGTERVLRARMVAGGHFMTQRFAAFNRPLRIEPPVKSDVG